MHEMNEMNDEKNDMNDMNDKNWQITLLLGEASYQTGYDAIIRKITFSSGLEKKATTRPYKLSNCTLIYLEDTMAFSSVMQGAMGGAIVGGAAGLALSYWKRDAPDDIASGSITATLRAANMHVDAEDAVQELIPLCGGRLGDMKVLIENLSALHKLSETEPPKSDSMLVRLRHSTEAQRHARGARDALTRLEVAQQNQPEHHQATFTQHVDQIEQAVKDDLYNINLATSAAVET